MACHSLLLSVVIRPLPLHFSADLIYLIRDSRTICQAVLRDKRNVYTLSPRRHIDGSLYIRSES